MNDGKIQQLEQVKQIVERRKQQILQNISYLEQEINKSENKDNIELIDEVNTKINNKKIEVREIENKIKDINNAKKTIKGRNTIINKNRNLIEDENKKIDDIEIRINQIEQEKQEEIIKVQKEHTAKINRLVKKAKKIEELKTLYSDEEESLAIINVQQNTIKKQLKNEKESMSFALEEIEKRYNLEKEEKNNVLSDVVKEINKANKTINTAIKTIESSYSKIITVENSVQEKVQNEYKKTEIRLENKQAENAEHYDDNDDNPGFKDEKENNKKEEANIDKNVKEQDNKIDEIKIEKSDKKETEYSRNREKYDIEADALYQRVLEETGSVYSAAEARMKYTRKKYKTYFPNLDDDDIDYNQCNQEENEEIEEVIQTIIIQEANSDSKGYVKIDDKRFDINRKLDVRTEAIVDDICFECVRNSNILFRKLAFKNLKSKIDMAIVNGIKYSIMPEIEECQKSERVYEYLRNIPGKIGSDELFNAHIKYQDAKQKTEKFMPRFKEILTQYIESIAGKSESDIPCYIEYRCPSDMTAKEYNRNAKYYNAIEDAGGEIKGKRYLFGTIIDESLDYQEENDNETSSEGNKSFVQKVNVNHEYAYQAVADNETTLKNIKKIKRR